MKKCNVLLLFSAVAFLAGGCAVHRPTLVQNEYLETVGEETALADVEACLEEARELHATFQDDTGGADTVARGAQGAATNAATGAVLGGDPLTGAVTSLVYTGVGGIMNALFNPNNKTPAEMDPELQAYVEDCLRSKGYEVDGWK